MSPIKSICAASFAASVLVLAGCATAQQPGVSDQDHQAHHPGGAPAQRTAQPGQGMGQGGMGMMGGPGGQGMMGGQGGQGMMGGQGGPGMMGGQGGQGMMDLCPMMGAAKSPEEHKSMFQQRMKNMSPDQVRQMMATMEKQMGLMQGDMQLMRDYLSKQAK